MHVRHYQNRETKWCRYSDHAHEFLRPSKPWRIGKLLRYGRAPEPTNRPPYAIVLWIGNKSTTTYARDFIEVFAVSKEEVPDIPQLPIIEHLLRSRAWHA